MIGLPAAGLAVDVLMAVFGFAGRSGGAGRGCAARPVLMLGVDCGVWAGGSLVRAGGPLVVAVAAVALPWLGCPVGLMVFLGVFRGDG